MTPSRTRAAFELPFGFEDTDGTVHRTGVLRLPTQRDLILAFKLGGEVDNPAYLELLLMAQMLVSLGPLDLGDLDRRQQIVEKLVQPDIEHLHAVYEGLLAGGAACRTCGRAPEGMP